MTAKKQRVRFGSYLKTSRENLGLSQNEVAQKIGHGSGQFISNIERGKCALPVRTLGELIKYYRLDTSEVIQMMVSDYRSKLEQDLLAEA